MRRRDLIAALGSSGLLLAPTPFAWAQGERRSIARTRVGRIGGTRVDGVHAFKGVAYGADTRSRRFQPPAPAPSWKGVRAAFEYGPACPQANTQERTSEDCLYLNVWTPGLRDGARRPVLVYIHGGEYSSGSGSSPLYDGARLCTRGDVVVVTVNHRLNIFGHLYLARIGGAPYAASGNVGLLDLIQALTWVRDHAEAFGGDPACVTVFGQSGGGAKIATLMAMPAARGLFHRAMTMSGQQITASGPRSATLRARACMNALGLQQAEALQRVDTAELAAAMRAPDPTLAGRAVYFGPVLDEASLPRHPFYPDAPPQSQSMPMIIGNTLEETRAFYGDDPGIHSLSWSELPERLLSALQVDASPEKVIAAYRCWYPQYSPTQIFFAATTAGRSWRGAVIEAELRATQGAPAYVYQLNYRSPLADGRYGAMHSMDIPLVFDNIAQPDSLTGVNAAARRTAEQMSAALVAFARSGDPNHAGIPQWRPYTPPERATMLFDAASTLAADPRGEERKLFAQVPYIQRGTY